MRIALVAHVGETFGHLARALSVADELAEAGDDVVLVASPSASTPIRTRSASYQHKSVPWGWSHNDFSPFDTAGRRRAFATRFAATAAALRVAFAELRPDAVLSFPGIVSAPAARSLEIPHLAVAHAPYLSPLLSRDGLECHERAVVTFLNHYWEAFSEPYNAAARAVALDHDYDHDRFLSAEAIVVPQPALPFWPPSNITTVGFITASFAPIGYDRLAADDQLSGLFDDGSVCYVTFGTGNPCDISDVIEAAATSFARVLVSTGDRNQANRRWPHNVSSATYIPSEVLIDRVTAVVSHGGIGTVGTFAARCVPQLVIPTEPDQAMMAVWGRRAGLVEEVGLREWAREARTGRHLSKLPHTHLQRALQALAQRSSRSAVSSASSDWWQGASAVARAVHGRLDRLCAPVTA